MIYTCTLNPSLDYYMEFSEPLKDSQTNRSLLEYYEAGGKGINVSIVLNNLMVPSRAFGFVGGFTKQFFVDLLLKYEYIQPRFTYIDGHTRINIKIKGKENIDLNAHGPYICSEHMDALNKRIDIVDEGDLFVFAGNVPEYLLNDVEAIIEKLANRGVKIILDTNATVLKRCLKYRPFLIRPSFEELEDLVNQKLVKDEMNEALYTALEKLYQQGAQNIMMSLGEQGTIFKCESGIYHTDIVQSVEIINTVGTNDSMVAGFIMNSLRSVDVVDSFRFASCCGIATYYSKGLATREKVNELYKNLAVEKIR